MGCDIHIYTEHKLGPKWICGQASTEVQEGEEEDNTPFCLDDFKGSRKYGHGGRDYSFFGFLADVRRYVPHHFEPKGQPDDLSLTLEDLLSQWGEDAHSASFITLREMEEKLHQVPALQAESLLDLTLTPTDTEVFNHCVARLRELADDLRAEAVQLGVVDEDLSRIVFFFDN